jgi:hypothetical protein
MQESLHITDKQYLVALTIFFFPYALLEVIVLLIRLINISYQFDRSRVI